MIRTGQKGDDMSRPERDTECCAAHEAELLQVRLNSEPEKQVVVL